MSRTSRFNKQTLIGKACNCNSECGRVLGEDFVQCHKCKNSQSITQCLEESYISKDCSNKWRICCNCATSAKNDHFPVIPTSAVPLAVHAENNDQSIPVVPVPVVPLAVHAENNGHFPVVPAPAENNDQLFPMVPVPVVPLAVHAENNGHFPVVSAPVLPLVVHAENNDQIIPMVPAPVVPLVEHIENNGHFPVVPAPVLPLAVHAENNDQLIPMVPAPVIPLVEYTENNDDANNAEEIANIVISAITTIAKKPEYSHDGHYRMLDPSQWKATFYKRKDANAKQMVELSASLLYDDDKDLYYICRKSVSDYILYSVTTMQLSVLIKAEFIWLLGTKYGDSSAPHISESIAAVKPPVEKVDLTGSDDPSFETDLYPKLKALVPRQVGSLEYTVDGRPAKYYPLSVPTSNTILAGKRSSNAKYFVNLLDIDKLSNDLFRYVCLGAFAPNKVKGPSRVYLSRCRLSGSNNHLIMWQLLLSTCNEPRVAVIMYNTVSEDFEAPDWLDDTVQCDPAASIENYSALEARYWNWLSNQGRLYDPSRCRLKEYADSGDLSTGNATKEEMEENHALWTPELPTQSSVVAKQTSRKRSVKNVDHYDPEPAKKLKPRGVADLRSNSTKKQKEQKVLIRNNALQEEGNIISTKQRSSYDLSHNSQGVAAQPDIWRTNLEKENESLRLSLLSHLEDVKADKSKSEDRWMAVTQSISKDWKEAAVALKNDGGCSEAAKAASEDKWLSALQSVSSQWSAAAISRNNADAANAAADKESRHCAEYREMVKFMITSKSNNAND